MESIFIYSWFIFLCLFVVVAFLSLGREDPCKRPLQQEEDGILLASAMESEKALQDNLYHSTIGTMDNHLVEFTEELKSKLCMITFTIQKKIHTKCRS